ncbi:hypothetical protein F5878DRAFT_299100 [Lentinula raphanica]|uniref:Uncharacterized protein n=1 Tax=Lentinula raphanica TaxID=153919 RepID=A0AA38P3K6_9AGAR|nr:hypothetical protein F5878DRAFT_299100 [Lentinula raphanica]
MSNSLTLSLSHSLTLSLSHSLTLSLSLSLSLSLTLSLSCTLSLSLSPFLHRSQDVLGISSGFPFCSTRGGSDCGFMKGVEDRRKWERSGRSSLGICSAGRDSWGCDVLVIAVLSAFPWYGSPADGDWFAVAGSGRETICRLPLP